MSRYIEIIVAVALIFLMLSPAVIAKPLAPLSVAIEPVGPVLAGTSATFVVTANNLSLEKTALRLDVSLPDDWRLLAGEVTWRGMLATGDSAELHFVVELPAHGRGEMAVALRQQEITASQFRADALFSLPITTARALSKQTGFKRETERFGRPIVEYKLP